MKIIQFNAENIKRLVAVEIKPEGNLVEITGKNGQGKTSILDAIWWALSNNKVVQANPVRDGAEKGFVRLDLGDYIVTKKFTRKADGEFTISLTVENQDGAKYGSPQELLNGFLGDLTFDPLAFARMKPKDQVTALRALVPAYDFDAAEKANKVDFDNRTDINRTIRDLGVRILVRVALLCHRLAALVSAHAICARETHPALHDKGRAPSHTGKCWCDYNKERVAKGEEPSGFSCSVCHSFVTDGQIRFLDDCTHALAGQTVPIPDFDEG